MKEQIDANRRSKGLAADCKSLVATWPTRIGAPAVRMS